MSQIFGEGDEMRLGVEVGWRALVTPVGSLGASIALGHARFSGRGRVARTGEQAHDRTSLTVLPVVASAVIRLDGAARRWSVPLVPFVKLGLARYGWLADGSGKRSSVDDPVAGHVVGTGHTFGWELQAGVAFLLDVLDPGQARVLEHVTGIDNSYLYAALLHASVHWGKDSMNLSDSTWSAGLLVEM